MRKKHLSFLVNSALSIVVLSGCGGSDNSSSIKTGIGTIKGIGSITDNVSKTTDGNISDSIKEIADKTDIKNINQNEVNYINNLLNGYQKVHFNIQ